MEITYKQNTLTKEELYNFLKQIDKDFTPSLSEVTDINAYAERLHSNAYIFEAWDCNELIAVLTMYANNEETKRAYISFAHCKKTHRKRGITTNLFKIGLDCLKKLSYNSVFLKCAEDNTTAFNLYKKLGFEVTSIDEQYSTKVIMEKKI